MKKIYILGLFALLIMQACKKNDQELIDGKRPEERVSADLEKYSKELVSSPNGWVAHLSTSVITGEYNFYMSFDDENKVIMRADYNPESALESAESTYRLKQVMAPSIIFDTYTLLHLLQDPDPNYFNGEYAVGYGSDFEFEIREQVGDTLKLIGKKRKTPLNLVKATAAEKTFYTSNQFSDNIQEIVDLVTNNPFTYILDPKDNNKKIQVTISPEPWNRSISFVSVSGKEIVNTSGAFSFSKEGIKFNASIKEAGLIFTDMLWDVALKKLFVVSTTGDKLELLISPSPVIPLHLMLGAGYQSITVPNATSYPGWGNDFITRKALANQKVSANISVGNDALTLGEMRFLFNTASSRVTLTWTAPFGANFINLTYPYSFTKSDDGIFKFTIIRDFDGNSGFVYNFTTKPLDPVLAERINTDKFKLDYFVHPTTGAVLGQFISIEHPDFTFTGSLQ